MKYMYGSNRSGAVQEGVCRRCQGLMVPCFTDSLFLEIAEGVRDPSWRCVNCGEWLDETIVSNRLRRHHAGSLSPESPPSSHRRRWRR
jgi:hypothetical protein